MMKLRSALAAAAVLILSATGAHAAHADVNLPPERTRIYETSGDGLSFPGWVVLPGGSGGSHGGGAAGGSGSGKGGDSSAGGDKGTKPATFANPSAGTNRKGREATLSVWRKGAEMDSFDTITLTNSRDLTALGSVDPKVVVNADGTKTSVGLQISVSLVLLSSPEETAKAIFQLTGSTFSSCAVAGQVYDCDFSRLKTVKRRVELLDLGEGRIAPELSDRVVPICDGTVRDSGAGVTSVISVADVACDAAPGTEPVRLEVDTIYSDLSLGIPVSRTGDGAIVVQPSSSSPGNYIQMKVWAVAADGTTSWPFYVVVASRYAPEAAPSATATAHEAIRGVDTVIPAAQLFSDVDVDLHAAESGDHLTSVVTEQGAMGGAWFDTAGDLHYQSIDVIRGEYTDHITVRTTDAFGLPSPELRLGIHITDIVPGCTTGTDTTDATTPVRIHLTCWITPTDGWHQIDGLTYRITEQPQYGTVTDLDPVSGIATYTPDPAHPEPATITFTATNNGATRTATHTIDVLPAP